MGNPGQCLKDTEAFLQGQTGACCFLSLFFAMFSLISVLQASLLLNGCFERDHHVDSIFRSLPPMQAGRRAGSAVLPVCPGKAQGELLGENAASQHARYVFRRGATWPSKANWLTVLPTEQAPSPTSCLDLSFSGDEK